VEEVEEEAEEDGRRRRRRADRIQKQKNKNPTQRCGKKLGYSDPGHNGNLLWGCSQ